MKPWQIIIGIWGVLSLAIFLRLAFQSLSSLAVYFFYTIMTLWILLLFCVGPCRRLSSTKTLLCWGLAILIPLVILMTYRFYAFVAESDPASPTSPCGKSSCSNQQTQTFFPYNPNSFAANPSGFSLQCPYYGCDWADANDQKFIGYAAETASPTTPNLTSPCTPGDASCAWLASSLPQDYPDLGRGLRGGLVLGAEATDTTFCPNVDTTAYNSFGTHGKGKVVCAICTASLTVNDGYQDNTAYCPAGDPDNFLCGMCVDASLHQSLWHRKMTFWMFVAHTVITIIFVFAVVLATESVIPAEYDDEKGL